MSALHRSTTRPLLLRWWGWLLLVTITFQIVIASRYFGVVDFDEAPSSLAFRAAMLVAHFTALSALLLSPVLLAIMLRLPHRACIAIGIAASVAALIVLLIDTQVYQLYRFHINAGVMNLLFGGAVLETFDFSSSMYVQAAAIALAIVAVQTIAAGLLWRFVRTRPGNRLVARAITLALVSSIVVFHSMHIWADVVAYEPLIEQTDVLPLRYAATAKRSLRSLGVRVRSRPALAGSSAADRSSLAYPLQPLSCEPADAPPNIIVILIDSWRFDALNAQVTPNLDAFARRSVRFMDHHSGGNATRMGVFSLFYSIPGTYWHRVLAERQGPVLIEQLLKHGYDVRPFRSAPLFSPEFDRTVFAQVRGVRMRSDGDDSAERDRDLTHDFLSFLDSRSSDAPFFALLFYDSPHKFAFPADYPLPFTPSAADVNYFGLDNATDPAPWLNRYRNSVHYVDGLVGEALRAIESRGLLDDSVVVITGDHGQELNDNGRNYWGHNSNFTRFQTGVPFLLYSPSLAPAVYQHRTTHFDVMPTLMRTYLGCDEPFSTYSVGRPLFEPGGRDTIVLSEYMDFAIVTPRRIAVVRGHGMQVLDASYGELEDGQLAPASIKAALEQKSRFYRRVALTPK